MKVLVTGGTGFVGSHVVRTLIANGHNVRLLVRNFEKAQQFFSTLGIELTDIVVGDITDRDFISKILIDCNAVVHAAAVTPMQAVSEQDLFKTNVEGVKTVIGAACDQCIEHIVFVSSITAIFSPDNAHLDANSPVVRSKHPYGKSKAEAEIYIRRLQAEGKPIKSVYPGGVIGPDDPGRSATVMALWYRIAQGFKITSGGTQQIDVRDLAGIIAGLLALNDGKGGRYITAGHYMTWSKFAFLLEDIIGRPLAKQKISGWFLRLVGFYYDTKRLFVKIDSPISAETMRYATQWPVIANDPIVKELITQLRSPRQTFTDTLAWMLQTGLLKPQDAPALANLKKNKS
jgi:dihydroflavonol-4-reductase